MIDFFNDYTVCAAAIAFVRGFGMYSFSRSGSAAAFVRTLSVVAFDLFVRLRNQDQEVLLLASKTGEHVCLVPVWLIGLVVGLWILCHRERPARSSKSL